LAGARAVLAFAFGFTSDQRRRTARRISQRDAVSPVLFVISALVPVPWRYALWGLALAQEAGLLLTEARTRGKTSRFAGADREEALAAAFAEPRQGELQVN